MWTRPSPSTATCGWMPLSGTRSNVTLSAPSAPAARPANARVRSPNAGVSNRLVPLTWFTRHLPRSPGPAEQPGDQPALADDRDGPAGAGVILLFVGDAQAVVE